VPDAVYLIEDLKPLRRAYRPTDILACIAKFLCCDIMAFAELSENVNEKLNSLWISVSKPAHMKTVGKAYLV
jgi:hypothetical protein